MASRLLDDSILDVPAGPDRLQQIHDPSLTDYFSDILPAIGTGLQLNAESYAGLPGDIEDLAYAGEILSKKYGGASPEELDAERKANATGRVFPNTEDVHQGITQLAANMPAVVSADSGIGAYRAAMTPVEPWQPKTGLGRGIQTVASMIGPGAIRHFTRDVITPLIGSEIGAEIGQGMGPEEEQLLSAGGGIAGGPISERAKRVAVTRVRGGPATPEQLRRLQTLDREGIPLTGGQALDSEGLRYTEVGPFASRPASVKDAQLRAFTNAALQRVVPNTAFDIADDVTMRTLDEQLGAEYDNLVRDNNGIVMDPDLQRRLTDIGVAHERAMGGPTNDSVAHFYERIRAAAEQNGTVIPPDIFQQINTELSQEIQRLRSSPQHAIQVQALREMRDGMYGALERHGQPEIADRAQDLARRYRNFKTIEKSLVGASGETAYGFITPEKLGQAVRSRDDAASYTQGRGEFDDLVKAGSGIKALPNSGTAARALPYLLAGGGAASQLTDIGSQLLDKHPIAALGTAAAMAAPTAASTYLNYTPVRTSIVNRARGVNPAYLEPMQMPPILGMSQRNMEYEAPAPVEEEPEEQSFLGNDYPVPVDLVDPADVLRRRGLRYG